MLLVMTTQGLLQPTNTGSFNLWDVTWQKIGTFLPTLQEELFPVVSASPDKVSSDAPVVKEEVTADVAEEAETVPPPVVETAVEGGSYISQIVE